ncbi:hypothetical protein H072_103 [Dactylellina haptotyla CBS 200.50]|uniref:Uncharacterized protein n=1 Tax=Dactylellina haptotyla (strain CBS 200.50) TaxID=1284197 RepID=S8AY71_DACHA|nr:hypothetical protein H072_103 [Dactylellina haptotyla CBS 200.50]
MQNREDYDRYGYGPVNPNPNQGNQNINAGQANIPTEDLDQTFGWNREEPVQANPQSNPFLNPRINSEADLSAPANQPTNLRPFAPAYLPSSGIYNLLGQFVEEEEKKTTDTAPPFDSRTSYYQNPQLQIPSDEESFISDRDYLEGTNEFEWDPSQTEEDQVTAGRKPSGQRSGQLSRVLSGSNQDFGVYGASRVSLGSNSPQFYRERGTNRIVPVRQLEYDDNFTDRPMTWSTVGAHQTLAAFRRRGVAVGRVTAAQLYDYITRPGIRPTDYVIIDTRGDDGEVRLDTLEQVQGRVRVIPFSEDRAKLTDAEVEQMSRMEPLSDSECDLKTVQQASKIYSRVVIVHCAVGNTRSPTTAAAISMMAGPDKTVLLLEGGATGFWKYVNDRNAQRAYYQRQESQRPEEVVRSQWHTSTAMTDEAIVENNPSLLLLPSSPEHRLNNAPTSGFLTNISPQYRRLVAGDRLSDFPWEEDDRSETIRRDGELFIQLYKDDPPPNTDGCRPTGRGGDQGGYPGPGGGTGGGSMGGGITKRGLNPFDIAGGRLRKRSWGIFMPESRGKGMRIVKRS